MTDKISRPFGLWDSPISPSSMASSKSLGGIRWDSDSRTLVWLEQRSGRGVLVAQTLGIDAPVEITETGNVRATVGYGGGDFTVASGYAYYFDAETKRLYRARLAGGPATAITPGFGAAAAPAISPDGNWVAYVHSYEGEDCIAIARADGSGWPQRLTSGADFYMWPEWHVSGNRLAWAEWDHPNMPWDGTRLMLASLAFHPGQPPTIDQKVALVAEEDVSVAEPRFSSDGRYLVYICDRDGYRNLYAYDLSTKTHSQLTQQDAEVGGPAWTQERRSYAIISGNRPVYVHIKDSLHALWSVRLDGSEPTVWASPVARYTYLNEVALSPDGKRLAVVASAPEVPSRVISIGLDGGAQERIHARAGAERIPPEEFAQPEAVTWQTSEGETIYGLYYPPHNPRFRSSGKPPAIIMIHGGPTGNVSIAYDPSAQFFATRGIGVLHVDYRGSTGHGKAYMRRLRGNWGIYDVEDAVGGVHFLAKTGRADPTRLAIMGGSAGGYTVWLCLAQHPGLFKVGVCSYGVTDLFSLAAETHKFETHYLDSLVGPLPEGAQLYRDRSPLFHADLIKDPVAVFQGDEDRVVPRAQSDQMVESLRRRGVPHEYHVYEGEGHGWRKAETVERFYTDVMRFLRQYLIFS